RRGDVERLAGGGGAQRLDAVEVAVLVERVRRAASGAAQREAGGVAVERERVRCRQRRRGACDAGGEVDPHLLADAEVAAAGIPAPAQQRAPGAGEIRQCGEGLRGGVP
ncbi:hypothetical protein RZS08_58610, partial [Arthrospira platensis SPKY1]|nr:hypothetical protein [Arthrospira platensis SPKY1]